MSQATQKLKEALELFNFIPGQTREGETAGGRKEGRIFRERMANILAPAEDTVLTTTIGKSSQGGKIDGSAVDRLSYKLVEFARNPSNKGRRLLVAVNVAFSKHESPYWTEILAQAAWLNTKSDGGRIQILYTEQGYRSYIQERFGEP